MQLRDAIFYHLYPLGMLGAPRHNDGTNEPQQRLQHLHAWIEHLRDLGANALYLGPLFESHSHGYDTTDYTLVDRRLGTNAMLADVITHAHSVGIRVILDGVFNHVGRDFWAFRDLQANGERSPYRDWFMGVDFGQRSPYGDAFAYQGWNGHLNLVKLNLHHEGVRAHLFDAVRRWIAEFDIDGLRLDAADVMDHGFLRDLAAVCRAARPGFWLIGEVIHGDYRQWANAGMLDATTNYEAYKGLFSSHNDHNYFEIGHTLNREFGANGLYRDVPLYNFADNHDVDRIASVLRNPAHLYPLHAILMTMPGTPSLYYGSEWGIAGAKHNGDDGPLRPAMLAPLSDAHAPHPDLARAIKRLIQLRQQHSALRSGSYQQLHVASDTLAFARTNGDEQIIVVASAATQPTRLELPLNAPNNSVLVDLLDPEARFAVRNGRVCIDLVPACWARVLRVDTNQ